jgi:sugar phosphate isomerase/epimerase
VRLTHPDGTTIHLAYCTNVHQAEDLPGVLAQLDRFALPVRERLGAGRLGLGLWLARDVAAGLAADPAGPRRLRAELQARGLEVVTLNGFPYAGFHAPVVKRAVYLPDWADRRRLDHTVDLARILLALLPDGAAGGSVSTLPLAWRTGWPEERADRGRRNLALLGEHLAKLAADAGRPVRVALEPEPGCVIETTAQAAGYLAGLDTDHVGVCLDACHLAVQFEDPAEAVAAATAAGVPVVKAQLGCAIRAERPADPATAAALARFAEPRFLHQTRAGAAGEGAAAGVDDLGEALAGGLRVDREWRVHFHAPVHAAATPPLGTTQTELVATMAAVVGGATPGTDHLEIETYTWGVLPAARQPAGDDGLVAGLADELSWTHARLVELGLRPA